MLISRVRWRTLLLSVLADKTVATFLDYSKDKAMAFIVSISEAIVPTITFSSVIYPIIRSSTSAYSIEKVA